MEEKNVSSLRKKLRYNCVKTVHDRPVISMRYEIWASVCGKCTLLSQMCLIIVCSSYINVLEQHAAVTEQKGKDGAARFSEMWVFIYQTIRDRNTKDRDQITTVLSVSD